MPVLGKTNTLTTHAHVLRIHTYIHRHKHTRPHLEHSYARASKAAQFDYLTRFIYMHTYTDTNIHGLTWNTHMPGSSKAAQFDYLTRFIYMHTYTDTNIHGLTWHTDMPGSSKAAQFDYLTRFIYIHTYTNKHTRPHLEHSYARASKAAQFDHDIIPLHHGLPPLQAVRARLRWRRLSLGGDA
jgi:hypothetical protein